MSLGGRIRVADRSLALPSQWRVVALNGRIAVARHSFWAAGSRWRTVALDYTIGVMHHSLDCPIAVAAPQIAVDRLIEVADRSRRLPDRSVRSRVWNRAAS
ncbi:hypothetical protein [Kibdelosporangium philippinense]|uniref:hypothetical protein n=1 Tax=Kibdelosporangium philippinense TaxID=211113 RepID=UPI00360F5A9E